MLTDIFANRYESVALWDTFEERDRRFLVQAFRIVSEQLYPYYSYDRKENPVAKAKWKTIHDKLSMELGLDALSAKAFAYNKTWQGKVSTISGTYTIDDICKNFVCAPHDGSCAADRFMKERMSFVEISFRERSVDIDAENARLPEELAKPELPKRPGTIRLPGNRADGIKARNARLNEGFWNAVAELNERIRQAGYPLNYHNGFIQISPDEQVEAQIERPFWSLVADPKWNNVDVDMKEAVDRRDNGDRDPAFYAAKSLESSIKIISNEKGWTHGGEKGAHNYIDNLGSRNAGFINDWEMKSLKDFFTHVRNPFGHGPGDQKMPELDPQQTNWAIEFCMSWIKSLICRM